MIKPDIVVSWPRNCDFPLWRQYIHANRSLFNEIIIAFTETNQGHDYREFITQAMLRDYVYCFQAPLPTATEDWRNLAVRASLQHSYNSQWLWFTEQDFLPKEGFWDDVSRAEHLGFKVMAVYEAERMHPCSILVKRDILDQTSKEFGIKPNQADHFYKLQRDLERICVQDIWVIHESLYTHFAGYSHNFTLLNTGQEPNHKPTEYRDWLIKSLTVNVPIDPHYRMRPRYG